MPPSVPLATVAALFLRLGVTAFGGPAVHVAMMEEEVVRRRKWLTSEEFLDLFGAANLIPGPNSTELAIHIGHRVAGWAGLLVAGACFILPAAAITLALAMVYARVGRLPVGVAVLWALKPVVVAVVANALWELSRKAIKTRALGALAALAIVASMAGADELLVLFGCGAVAVAFSRPNATPFFLALPGAVAVKVAATPTAIFLVFAKIGSVLFGSGYVLVAFLRTDLVHRLGWLTEAQLLDAIAAGQVTPGPVFTTATFVGHVVGGVPGALAATAGIFVPAFFFVAISAPLVPRLRKSPAAGRFLDGVNAASLALMAVALFHLARGSVRDVITVGIAVASLIAIVRFKVNTAWLVVGAAVVGAALHGLGVQ